MRNGSSIELKKASITLGHQPITSDIDLTIEAGEFVCILGPSGCGKSTLLNAIAGFLPYEGEVLVAGEPVTAPHVSRGVVFQSSEVLFPWLTAAENVEYGLKVRRIPAKERSQSSQKYLELVGLAHSSHKFPRQLSGGMRQRLQIARVLVNEPAIVLMDEPFGALDAQTRDVMQRELSRIWEATRPTILFVTHDIIEAIMLADRIITMTVGPRAGIKSIHSVTMARPRDEMEPDFLALYQTLRAEIGEEVEKVLQNQGVTSH